jgi:hydroxyethylthiazole kinase-like sugar kinase family protein
MSAAVAPVNEKQVFVRNLPFDVTNEVRANQSANSTTSVEAYPCMLQYVGSVRFL